MADNENIIEDLDTLLGQPINEQPVDRGEADITAFDLLNLNQQAPFIEKLKEAYAREDDPDQFKIPGAVVPGFISQATVDYAGIANRLIDPSVGQLGIIGTLIHGGDPNRGPIDYIRNTFGEAYEPYDGRSPEDVSMFISDEELKALPHLREYFDNTSAMMFDNSVRQFGEFMDEKGFNKGTNEENEEAYNDWLLDTIEKEATPEGLSEEDLEDLRLVQKLWFQKNNPQPYRKVEGGIEILPQMLPEVAHEPNPKFRKHGDKLSLQLPYYGTLSKNKKGKLTMDAASVFRATENPGILSAFKKYLPKQEEQFGKYLYPKLSPEWSYGETPEDTRGYQMGQLLGGYKMAKPIAKGLAALYNKVKAPLWYTGVTQSNPMENIAKFKEMNWMPDE